MALLNQGADLIAGWGVNAVMNAAMRAERETDHGIGVFGAASGGWSRYKTGSRTEIVGITFLTGLAERKNFQHGDLSIGGFFEYGVGA